MRVHKFITTALLSFASLFAVGQGEANIWYFGANLGLDFTNANATTAPTVISGMASVEASDNIMESASSISDAAGNFLFGTNGQDIYSADKQKRGTLPLGSNAQQA